MFDRITDRFRRQSALDKNSPQLDAAGLAWFKELYVQYLRLRPQHLATGVMKDEPATKPEAAADLGADAAAIVKGIKSKCVNAPILVRETGKPVESINEVKQEAPAPQPAVAADPVTASATVPPTDVPQLPPQPPIPEEPPTAIADQVTLVLDERLNARKALDALNPDSRPVLYQQDLYDVENWLLVVLEKEELAERLKAVRAEYQDVFGAEAWTKILPTVQPVVEVAKQVENRAEARRLQGELHWQASIRPWAQHTRQDLMLWVICILLVVAAVAICCLNFFELNLFGVLGLAGALGGAVGSIQRIQSADLANSRAFDLARHASMQLGVIIAPLLGAIFAILLTLIVLTRSVSPGFIIPDVTVSCTTNCACLSSNAVAKTSVMSETNAPALAVNTNKSLVIVSNVVPTSNSVVTAIGSNSLPPVLAVAQTASNKTPEPTKPEKVDGCKYEFFSLQLCFASGKDLVLLILLAFVAGFSERLVPDLLTKLADSKKP